MSESKLARPPQVTMAAWVTILGSAFLVFSIFEVVANLRSLDTRTGLEESLADPPLDSLGIDIEQALDLLHALSIVAAACATAAAILGWQVLQRNRLARVVLTVLVVPLFLAGIVTGGFLSSMVTVAVILLWTRPARDWFDGIAPQPATGAGGSSGSAPSPWDRPDHPTSLPSPQDQQGPSDPDGRDRVPAGEPPRYDGFGALPPQDPSGAAGRPQEATGQAPAWATGTTLAQRPAAARRPREVVQACIVTWVFSGLVLLGMLVAVAALVADPSLVDEVYASDPRLADSGVPADALRSFTIVLTAVFAAWAAVSALLGVLTFLGRGWARLSLIISASVAGVLSLFMGVAALPLLILTLACAATVVLLVRPASNAWFDSAPDRRNS